MASKPSLLIVEDDPDIQTILSRGLAQDCEVTVAGRGAEGLALAKASPPDIILLDLNLPDTTGYAICRELKADKRFERTPIIFLTAHDELDKEIKGLDAGAIDYITKPVNLLLLRARLKNHLALVAGK